MGFSATTPVADPTAGRYTVGESVPTSEGRVAVGRNTKGSEFLVHTVGRTAEQMALHAVAIGTASGKLISYREFADAVSECGDPAALISALERVIPAKPRKPRGRKAGEAPAS